MHAVFIDDWIYSLEDLVRICEEDFRICLEIYWNGEYQEAEQHYVNKKTLTARKEDSLSESALHKVFKALPKSVPPAKNG